MTSATSQDTAEVAEFKTENAEINMKRIPSVELLNELFEYNHEDGKLYWRVSKGNRRQGKEAGHMHIQKYRRVTIKNETYRTARLIYFMFHGEEPNYIDHINGDTLDNRIKNLRSVTPLENSKNRKRPSHNTSGHMGVSFRKSSGKWYTKISVDGTQKSLGHFDNIEDAAAARAAAEIKYGYHVNHGREPTVNCGV